MCLRNNSITYCRSWLGRMVGLLERSRRTRRRELCLESKFRVAKVIRVSSIQQLEPLVRQGTKVMHLALDPRGTVSSRLKSHFRNHTTAAMMENLQHSKWRNITGKAAMKLCPEYQSDMKYLEYALKSPPWSSNYLFLRYEDLVTDSVQQAQRMFAFLGLSLPDRVLHCISNPTANLTEHTSHEFFTISKANWTDTAFKWRSFMPLQLVQEIQDVCGEYMYKAGYVLANSTEDLTNHEKLLTYLKYPT